MEFDDKTGDRRPGLADRRPEAGFGPRFEVGAEAEVFFVGRGLSLNCRLLDISLHGCRVHITRRIPHGARVPVEVTFSVNGNPIVIGGVIRRSTGQEQVRIEFAAMSAQRTAEWTEIVDDVHRVLAVQSEAEVAATAVFRPMPGDERRTASRFQCKGVAEIRVLPLGSRRPGTLLDLSAGGCCIEMRDPFPAAEEPSAVEVFFTLDGFQLRVAGVVRNVSEDHRAGIEFTDVTERKAAQIEELVAELIETDKSRRSPAGKAAG